MKKIKLLSLMLLLLPFVPVKADEGMWILPLLEKMNSGRMTELGFEITPQEIYDLNNTALKDAIVIFGNGCTGEIVSDQGLLFTNHHCGYAAIQQLSSVEHNYLKDGFWAMNTNEELYAEGLTVSFLESFTDVTDQVEKALKKSKTQEDKAKALDKLQDKLCKKAGCDDKFIVGQLTSQDPGRQGQGSGQAAGQALQEGRLRRQVHRGTADLVLRRQYILFHSV